jgi:superfamily II helicase
MNTVPLDTSNAHTILTNLCIAANIEGGNFDQTAVIRDNSVVQLAMDLHELVRICLGQSVLRQDFDKSNVRYHDLAALATCAANLMNKKTGAKVIDAVSNALLDRCHQIAEALHQSDPAQ